MMCHLFPNTRCELTRFLVVAADISAAENQGDKKFSQLRSKQLPSSDHQQTTLHASAFTEGNAVAAKSKARPQSATSRSLAQSFVSSTAAQSAATVDAAKSKPRPQSARSTSVGTVSSHVLHVVAGSSITDSGMNSKTASRMPNNSVKKKAQTAASPAEHDTKQQPEQMHALPLPSSRIRPRTPSSTNQVCIFLIFALLPSGCFAAV
jgi:hypothetical protein